ncbi:MAG: sensor histidine kinase [Oscillospiraceae bacterium]
MKTWKDIAMQAVLLGLSAICLLVVSRNSNQAAMSLPLTLGFEGEYSRDGVEWFPLETSDLPAEKGELILRGHFQSDIHEGSRINYFRDHIGLSLYVNGELLYMDSTVYLAAAGIDLMPSMCGREWSWILSPGITTEDEVEIHLHNWHSFGNRHAYQAFLDTLFAGPNNSDMLANYLKPYCQPFKLAGWFILSAALMLIGASATAAALRVPIGGRLWKFGLLATCAGGFILLNTADFSLESGLLVFNTYGRQLCMMLFAFWLALCAADSLTGRTGRLGRIAVLLSALLDGVLILLSFTGVTVIFDTGIYWAVSQAILCPLLLFCCGWELRRSAGETRIFLMSYMLLFCTILLDLAGVGASLYSQATCTKIVFSLLLVFLILRTAKQTVMNQQAADRARKLEQELEDSRIAIMRSQIKPHFIYNTLGTIQQFCLSQPEKAAELVQDFSLYLRGNLNELDDHAPICLSQEIEHVKHYVNIEHVRFPDMHIEFDLQSGEFFLPALSIQPLVENAIKHGLMGLESGGTVVISTYETDDEYCVCVKDDGVGFDESALQDGRRHIGIQNTRRRVEAMCGGSLTVSSTPGAGTTALITIPKKVTK